MKEKNGQMLKKINEVPHFSENACFPSVSDAFQTQKN